MKQIEILQRTFRFRGDDRTDFFCVNCVTDNRLNVKQVQYVRLNANGMLPDNWRYSFRTTSDIADIIPASQADGTLGGTYAPSNNLPTLDTIVPDNMDAETREAFANLRKAIGGDIAGFVCAKLKMSMADLSKSLKAEQVDAVALAIYNIEARQQGLIIGDQTGIGKGRQAAAVIRYAIKNGLVPIFVTQRANLFSDIYRDCKALGIGAARPLILNSSAYVVDFSQKAKDYVEPTQAPGESDEDFDKRLGKALAKAYPVIYSTSPIVKELRSGYGLPDGYDYVMTTYSQFNNLKRGVKGEWLESIVRERKCVFILDEAHTASGASSNTGKFFRELLTKSYGAVFLSATFAKRPENMALYAAKTVIADAGLSDDDLTYAITTGGIPLQELLSCNLVRHGQMIRRERDMTNVIVRYISLDATGAREFGVTDSSMRDRDNSDIITGIMRQMVILQSGAMDKDGCATAIRHAMSEASRRCGYGNDLEYALEAQPISPLESLFRLIEGLLLATKATSIAERTLQHVKEGRKVVICISKTNESTIKRALNVNGEPCDVGDVVDGGFRSALMDVYKTLLWSRVTISTNDSRVIAAARLLGFEVTHEGDGSDKKTVIKGRYNHEWLVSDSARASRQEILRQIDALRLAMPMSPIDYMRHLIESAGVNVGECTGRAVRLRYDSDDVSRAVVEGCEKSNVASIYNRFQNNELDVMIINQTGATGASCHAVPTDVVPADEVKQRVMIIAQPELDVNIEMQKRGRINRTGQLPNLPPIYEYVTSAIPAEQRMLMMLKRKLKSLDANTSSNQRQNDTMLEYPDFQNKYGDAYIGEEWLPSHKEAAKAMWLDTKPKRQTAAKDDCYAGIASKVSGRIAILNCDVQDEFYDDVKRHYEQSVEAAKESGTYNMEVTTLNLKAQRVDSMLISCGDNTDNFFGGKLYLNKYRFERKVTPIMFSDVVRHIDEARKSFPAIKKRWDDYCARKRDEFKASRLAPGGSDDWLDKYMAQGKSADEMQWETQVKSLSIWFNSAQDLYGGDTLTDETICRSIHDMRDSDIYAFVGFRSQSGKWDFDMRGDVVAVFDSTDKEALRHEVRDIAQLQDLGISDVCLPFPEESSVERVARAWNRAAERSKAVECVIMEGNLLAAYMRTSTNWGKRVVYFTTADGKTRSGLLFSQNVMRQVWENREWRGDPSRTATVLLTDKVIDAVCNTAEPHGEGVRYLPLYVKRNGGYTWNDGITGFNVRDMTYSYYDAMGHMTKERVHSRQALADLLRNEVRRIGKALYIDIDISSYPALRQCAWPSLKWNVADIPPSHSPITLSDAATWRKTQLRVKLRLKIAMAEKEKLLINNH